MNDERGKGQETQWFNNEKENAFLFFSKLFFLLYSLVITAPPPLLFTFQL